MLRLLYLTLVLFLATSFYGCSRDNYDVNGDAIELLVAPEHPLWSAETRAPMVGWFNTKTYVAYGVSPAATPAFSSFSRALDATVVGNRTVFQPLLFYPGAGDEIYLRGFYPRDGITNLDSNLSIINNKIEYDISGQEDIMISNRLNGSKTNPIKDQIPTQYLTYYHLLSRISFNLIGEEGFPPSLRVKGIYIKNLKTKAVLDITKNYDDAGCLTFTEPSGASTFTCYENSEGLILKSIGSGHLGNVMFEPGAHFSVEIHMSDGTVVTIDEIISDSNDITEGNTERGKYYKVVFNFKINSGKLNIDAKWNVVEVDDTQHGWW